MYCFIIYIKFNYIDCCIFGVIIYYDVYDCYCICYIICIICNLFVLLCIYFIMHSICCIGYLFEK